MHHENGDNIMGRERCPCNRDIWGPRYLAYGIQQMKEPFESLVD